MKDQYRLYPHGWRDWPVGSRLSAINLNNSRADIIDRINNYYGTDGPPDRLPKAALIKLYDDLYDELEPDPPMIGKTEEENEELERALVELRAD